MSQPRPTPYSLDGYSRYPQYLYCTTLLADFPFDPIKNSSFIDRKTGKVPGLLNNPDGDAQFHTQFQMEAWS